MHLNKVQLIGNVTNQPETKSTNTGKNVTTFSIATNYVYKTEQGKKESVEFHNIVAWGKLSEIITKHVNRGDKIYIEGRLQTRDWVGQDEVKRYRTEIIAENMIMLGSPKTQETSTDRGTQFNDVAGMGQADIGEADIKVENIPF